MWPLRNFSQLLPLMESAQYSGTSVMNRFARLLAQPMMNHKQSRCVVIVKRKLPTGVTKEPGKELKPFKRDHYFYEFVEDTQHISRKTVKVILIEDVPGVGLQNDIVAVRKGLVRNKLIPENLAVYASPENMKERALNLQKDATGPKRLSLLAQETIQHMKSKPLRVVLHEDQEWDELSKEPVLQAFKKDGVFVPDYALQLPDDPITDYGTYHVQVTINGIKIVPIEMHVIKKERERTENDALD